MTAPQRPASERWEALAYGLAVSCLWAVALMLDPAGRESFRLPKSIAAASLALASLVALALAGRIVVSRRLVDSPALRAALPLAFAATLASLASPHRAHVLRAAPGLAVALLTLVGWGNGFTSARLRRLLDATLLPASLLATIGILQFHGLFRPFGFSGPMLARFETTSLAGNVGDLGAALVLPALVAQAALATATSHRERWRRGVQLALLAYAIGASQTIAALLSLCAGSFAIWAIRLPRRRLLLGLGGLVVAAILAVGLVAPLRSRVVEKAQALAAGDVNRVLTGRLDGWRAALRMLGTHPALGVGQGAFAAAFVPVKLELLDAGVTFFAEQQQVVFANAHNELLEVGAETGIAGLLALVWALGQVFGAVKEKRQGPDRALAVAGVAAIAVLSLAYFPFRVAIVGYPILVFLAWLLHQASSDTADEQPTRSARLAVAAALTVALFLLLGVARDRFLANRLLRAAEARTMQAFSIATSPRGKAVLEGNLVLLDEARRRDPAEVGVLVARGSQFLLLGRAESAAAAYREALALEPRPETYLNLARALKMAGHESEAGRELAVALRLSPHLAAEVGSGN